MGVPPLSFDRLQEHWRHTVWLMASYYCEMSSLVQRFSMACRYPVEGDRCRQGILLARCVEDGIGSDNIVLELPLERWRTEGDVSAFPRRPKFVNLLVPASKRNFRRSSESGCLVSRKMSWFSSRVIIIAITIITVPHLRKSYAELFHYINPRSGLYKAVNSLFGVMPIRLAHLIDSCQVFRIRRIDQD